MSLEVWGDEGPEQLPWKDCEYCSAEPGENSSFYCEECCGMGGHVKEYLDEDWI